MSYHCYPIEGGTEMTRLLAALFAAMLFLPAAAFQDPPKDDKEKQKEEQKKLDDEAKAAIKAYTDKRKKAKSEDEMVDSMAPLKEARPHKLVRAELTGILVGKWPYLMRTEAAAFLRGYKKDVSVCDTLIKVAKAERIPESLDLRKRCLRSFAEIAPFAKSVDLQQLFADVETKVAREAVEAAETIKSVRMLPSLVALWGELERIREDDSKDPGPGGGGPEVPGGGGPKEGDNSSKRQRKEDLLDPAKKAVASLFGKVDAKIQVKTYTEANKALGEKRSQIKKLQDEEDEKDRKEIRNP